MINKIMEKFMASSCKTAGELTEKELAVGLSFVEKAKHRMHLKVCEVCTSYHKHSIFVDKTVDKMMEENDKKEFLLPEATKARIISKING